MATLSLIATYDDLCRYQSVLSDGLAEEEFLKFVNNHDKCRNLWYGAVQEAHRLQKELDGCLKTMADLETKLSYARRLLELENRSRQKAETDREAMEKKMLAVNEILRNERDINDETRNKIAGLNVHPRKRKSATYKQAEQEKYGNEINSTGSFLSDLSVTQSEEDYLNPSTSKHYKKHRSSVNELSGVYVGSKKSRLSTDKRKSLGQNVSKHRNIDIDDNDKIIAHTKVSIPQGDGPILAESIIEAVPNRHAPEPQTPKTRRSHTRATDNYFTPSAPPAEDAPMSVPKNVFSKKIMRPHNFTSRTVFKMDHCNYCQKKIHFGAVGCKCRDCKVTVHADCRERLTVACVPQGTGTPVKGVVGSISDYTPSVGPMVPALIVHCVNEIETRGLTEVGIYRVSGSERDVKALKERFLRGKGIPHLGNIDVHVLCGCIKDFLRSLREPLIPTSLWKDFSNAVQNVSQEKSVREIYNAIDKLPIQNRDTLAFLIQHFQRVADSVEVKMPITNLAKVFGPTIVGYSSAEPDQHAMFTETVIQYNILDCLLNIPTDYWGRFVNIDLTSEATTTDSGDTNRKRSNSIFSTPFRSTSTSRKDRKFYETPPLSSRKK